MKIKEQGKPDPMAGNDLNMDFNSFDGNRPPGNNPVRIILLCAAILCGIIVLIYLLFYKNKEQVISTDIKMDTISTSVDKMKDRELTLKEKELELKERELQQQKEISDKLLANKNSKPNRNNNSTNNYQESFPQASDRYLTSADLYGRSQWDLKIMRNEIFARHGYIFQTDEMRDYFSNKSWYSPKYYDVNNMLSDVEKENIALIKKFEK